MLVLVLAIATVSAAAPPDPAEPVPHMIPREWWARCSEVSSANEVVVCARDDIDSRYRLKPLDHGPYRDEPVRAEMRVFGNGTLSLHNDEVKLGSQISKRAMITLKLPF